jgi:hypothetical protein
MRVAARIRDHAVEPVTVVLGVTNGNVISVTRH